MRILVVTNLYPSAESPASGVFIEQQVNGLVSLGLKVRVLFVDRRREGPWAYYQLGPRIRNTVAEFAPHLVHVMYGGVMASQVTRQPGLPPVIVTFHGSDLLGENLSGLRRKLISHYGVHCSRKAARRARGIVVVARHLLNALGGVLSHHKVRIIPCGIDLERFKPMDQASCRQRLKWETDCAHVLFATANSDPVKRPWLARAAMDHLASEDVSAQLHVLSGVPNAEVPVWLNASDALLLTSEHEGSPTIVKEALACGLPVVSVDAGDVAERIAGIEGCYLAKADSADLALKLRWVFERQQRLNCRAQLQELSCVAIARKLERFYEEILQS